MTTDRQETGLTDCEGQKVRVGDLIECSAPIFTKAKRFVIGYDDIAGRYNYPIAAELSSHCRVITLDEH
jgi:hypothetical protein